MLTRTEGIVLRTQDYGEADLIVTFITPDRGIIKLFAKSPRKTKSRFGSSLEPLTHSRIAFWGKEQANLPKITQSDIINSFHQLREDYECFVNVSRLIEMILALTPPGMGNKQIFSFLLNVLELLIASVPADRDALHLITRIRFLALSGCAPRLSGCGRCGAKSHDFYPDAGTVLCAGCVIKKGEAGKPFIRISSKTVQFYTHTIEWPIMKSNRLRPDSATLQALSQLIDRHLGYMLSRRLRSAEFPAPSTGVHAG
jgi:DNA repair protein RecO (recombination protein O)